jgi:hypothetical protein
MRFHVDQRELEELLGNAEFWMSINSVRAGDREDAKARNHLISQSVERFIEADFPVDLERG